jgi:acyl carrier protein
MPEQTVSSADAAQSTIREFIFDKFPAARGREMSDEDSLLEQGTVDSLGVLEIVGFLEKQFGFTLSDDEMVADHFDSIASMARFVRQKLGTE